MKIYLNLLQLCIVNCRLFSRTRCIGPDQLILINLMSHKSTLLPSCVHSGLLHIVESSMRHLVSFHSIRPNANVNRDKNYNQQLSDMILSKNCEI